MQRSDVPGGKGLNRRILGLAVPAFGALIAEPLFLLADTVIVGRLGTEPLAGVALAVRDRTGRPSHLYLEWSDGSPLVNSLRFLLLGRGQTATAVHEVLRRAVPRKQDRPFVHVT